jgi:hypothetical protein
MPLKALHVLDATSSGPFSCKGRGVCPSCNGRHMAKTAAHLVDYVIQPVPVR